MTAWVLILGSVIFAVIMRRFGILLGEDSASRCTFWTRVILGGIFYPICAIIWWYGMQLLMETRCG